GSIFLVGIFAAFVFPASPVFGIEKNLLEAVVHIRATVPEDARTARFLGTYRQGSGVIIDN
ncbi:MAG: serine protease, partial [Rhodospirillales bacterium]|nr:serine protease [Rhodospirillales bacterium]